MVSRRVVAVVIQLLLISINSYILNAACGSEEWECDDGRCISYLEHCDGVKDCSDGSDETVENCIHTRRYCPEYSFTCAYGACVVNKPCDGNPQCADNSDELPVLCEKDRDWDQVFQGTCNDGMFQCRETKECISSESKCDGRLDCADSSDETLEVCGAFSCPKYAFRCGYGACIQGTSACNNVTDCADESDEALQLCGYPRRPGVDHKIITTSSTTTTTTTPRPKPQPVPQHPVQHCELPSDENGLIFLNLNDGNRTLNRYAHVPLNAVVGYKCEPRHSLEYLEELDYNVCSSSGWISTRWPNCKKQCSGLSLTGDSTHTTCYYNNAPVSCNGFVRAGTVAHINCAVGFKQPTYGVFENYLTCKENGQWDKNRTPCEMICGLKAPKFTVFALGGVDVIPKEVPWNVGIYSMHKETTYEFQCGGTIVAPRIVVSAAHCFWDSTRMQAFNKSLYQIAAGKYRRDFYNDLDEPGIVQKFNLSDLILSQGYQRQNIDQVHKYDIAVLVLKERLKFSESVLPACVHFPDNAGQTVNSGLTGSFVGWGSTGTTKASDELSALTMKTVSNEDCKERIPRLPDDKFCLTNDQGEQACRGDSGSGFFFANKELGQTIYVLVGVISFAQDRQLECAKEVVAVTNTRYYKSLVATKISEGNSYF